MTDDNSEVTQDTTEVVKEKGPAKSIVPAKYAGKYKEGGGDVLAQLINAECKSAEGFSYDKFFQLCLANGIPAEKVTHYEEQVNAKRNGSQGRARMTLRNMLASIARKTKQIKGLDGTEHEIDLPKPALTGAAKAAKDKEAEAQEAA